MASPGRFISQQLNALPAMTQKKSFELSLLHCDPVKCNGKLISFGCTNEVLTENLLSEVYGLPIKIDQNSKIITYY